MVEDRLSLIFRQRRANNGDVTLLLANEAFAFLAKLIANVLWHLRNKRYNLVSKRARQTLQNIIELSFIKRNCRPVERGDVVENHGVGRSAQHVAKLFNICDIKHVLLRRMNVVGNSIEIINRIRRGCECGWSRTRRNSKRAASKASAVGFVSLTNLESLNGFLKAQDLFQYP